MRRKLNEEYHRENELERDIQNLENKIDNIDYDSIIDDSKIEEIDNSISNIELRIKKTKRHNKIKSCIKNIKIFGKALQGIAPYVVVAGLIFGVQTITYDVPFYPQNEFHITLHEELIDQNGLFDDKISYVSPSNVPRNSVYYSTKWEKKSDGKFYRTIKEYNVGDYTIEELREIVSKKDLNIEEIFGNKFTTKYEVKDELSSKELEEETGLKIVYRYTDDEDVILSAQNIGQNAFYSVIYILFTLLCFYPIMEWRSDGSFDFERFVNRIKRENRNVDITELVKLFEEKKIKFEKVKRQQCLVESNTNSKVLIKK